jgi:hypothetical protein
MHNTRKVACSRTSDLNQLNSILLKTCALALLAMPTISTAQAQQSTMPPSVGQVSTAPGASSGAGTISAPMSAPMYNPLSSPMPGSMSNTSQSSMTNDFNPAAKLTPTNTTGNTASSVRTGIQSSGYSAGGSTVNSNINSTQTTGAGLPVGGGAQTSQAYAARKKF